ncbi:Macrolide export ATP-binding/permease protein MacB [Polystyrenella longa]|uniref:Macrolide export ATP-binding/permease protein MacB n=1 Tax=Polystyrenella longa TaxID=2528007 RepID=A0A518CSZ9_9PLAN|nr:ABC transporter ATP-binding protein [Polystyrenella longa]QDU82352.1 Macrolide export ATP-binding/permease protein MacB [Polystyrenella longa]
MYHLDSITQSYHRRGNTIKALDDCSLEIADNDFLAIVGPSGSGKTTLLSVLGGMLAPTSGKVELEGVSLYDLSLEERAALRNQKIGFVFQTFNLVSWLTACENVQIPMMLSGVAAPQQKEQAMALLERVGLADRTDHRPSELSQGQQQRVALARTLANNPQVILADEPTGNLDPETRKQVMSFLTEFHEDGRTIVMVTHDEKTASYANRSIQLVEGVPRELARTHAA